MSSIDFEYISSKQNEKVKRIAKLSMRKYREEERLFLAEGTKLSDEAVTCGEARFVLVADGKDNDASIKRVLDKCGDDVIKYILAAPVFEKVSTESAPQGIVTVAEYPSSYYDLNDGDCVPEGRTVALDGIRDPGNLGTIIRTAAAFGYDNLLLGDCTDVFNPKTVRASMGAIFKVKIFESARLATVLKRVSDSGRRVIGTALRDDALDFSKIELAASDIPVIGNEGHGISDEVAASCTSFVKIPISDLTESLNASAAASVIMWEYSKL